MTDLDIYRARIGLNNVKRMSNRSRNYNLRQSSGITRHRRAAMLVFAVGLVCLALYLGLIMECNLVIQNSKCKITSGKANCTDVGFKSLFCIYGASDWNSIMKSYNGNIKNSLNVAHWNGGSSHLAKSSKGKEKLEHVKSLISKYNIDVFGLSEANLNKSTDDFAVKIDKYKVSKLV